MLPILQFAGDGEEHSIREAIENISEKFNLNPEERSFVLPSGHQFIIDNRVGWARTYMKKAGLLDTPRRGFFRITDTGKKVLSEKPEAIDVNFLQQFPSFNEFRTFRREEEGVPTREGSEGSLTQTPQEQIEDGYQKIRANLAQEILTAIKGCSPRFFEKLVVELLLGMGYGGDIEGAGRAIGQSGDGGIDGVIKEDKLGLDEIYIQAKRWEASVGAPLVRNFVGSLAGRNANKGVLITTSDFTRDALDYVKTVSHKVILINGETLVRLMIDHGIGVSRVANYEVKKIDAEYFSETE